MSFLVARRRRFQASARAQAVAPPLDPPTLTVNKVVVNDDGGTAEAGDFALWVDGGPTR